GFSGMKRRPGKGVQGPLDAAHRRIDRLAFDLETAAAPLVIEAEREHRLVDAEEIRRVVAVVSGERKLAGQAGAEGGAPGNGAGALRAIKEPARQFELPLERQLVAAPPAGLRQRPEIEVERRAVQHVKLIVELGGASKVEGPHEAGPQIAPGRLD